MSIRVPSRTDETVADGAGGLQKHDGFAINKSEAVPVVLQWLENNYEQHADSSTPKHDVYADYMEFCLKHRIEPTSASAFGRLVRLAFPATTSRRLGARGANVTVYNNFRRRELGLTPASDDGSSQDIGANKRHMPHPSSASTSASSAHGPPSPSSRAVLEDLHRRLRGGGSNKPDGRTNSLDELNLGRTSSVGASSGQWKPSSSLEMGLEDEEEQEHHDDLQGDIFEDGFIPQLLPSALARRLSSRSDSTGFELSPPVSSNTRLMKMLKGEENGAELYDSLQRLLHGSTRTARQQTSLSEPEGMDIESGSCVSRPSKDASALQVQLYRGPNQPKEERKPGLWNADTHLHLMKLCETYRDGYIHNLWLLHPLHAAALEDDNIRYIMCTDEGAEERSPLSLSIYWILYSGALMEGHIERALEFYSIARKHLAFVFDQTDSSISLVLLPMAYHSRFWAETEAEGVAKCSYYLTLAMEICKRIGCLGSSVYISCLQMYAWFCMTDNSSLSPEEKLLEIKKGSYYPTMSMSLQATAIPRNAKTSVNIPISHLQMVEKMFGVVGNIMKGIFIFKSTIYPEYGCRPQACSAAPSALSGYQYNSQPPYRQSHKRKQPDDYSEGGHEEAGHERRYRSGYSGGAPPSKYPRQDDSMQSGQSEELHHSFGPALYQNMFMPNNTLQPLLLPLDTMEKDLELLMQSNNPLPTNIYMMFKLWILGERAECLWCMGQPEEALHMALLFLEISKRSTKNFISHYVSIQPILEMVLNIFLCTTRFNQFRELVDAILEPLDPSIPHVSRSKARYLSSLFTANPSFASSSEIDNSSTTDTSSSYLNGGSGDPTEEVSSEGGSYTSVIPGTTGGGPGRPSNGNGTNSPSLYGNSTGEDGASEQLQERSRSLEVSD